MDMKMTMNMSEVEKIAFQIANDLKQIKTQRQNRYKVIMVKIEKLGANLARHLKLIEKRQQERADKICGVCYDCEATCRLDCMHKICERCYPMMDKCPFCRKDYKCSRHWHIKNDYEIDIKLNKSNLLGLYTSMIDEIAYLEDRLEKNMYRRSVILGICTYINNMFGKYIYYREMTQYGMKYQRTELSDTVIEVAIRRHFLLSTISTIQKEEVIKRLTQINNKILKNFVYFNY